MFDIIVTDERLRNEDGTVNQFIRGSEGAAGFDLVAWPKTTVVVEPQQDAILIPTGVKLHIGSPNYVGLIFPRSGMGHKKGMTLGPTVGVIDSDYQGDLYISAVNRNQPDSEGIVINPGDRVAQIVFVPVMIPALREVLSFGNTTERAGGGFGSTGV